MSCHRLAVLCGVMVALGVCCGISAQAQEVPKGKASPTALQDYIALADNAFAWKLTDKRVAAGAKVYEIELTSQRWQDMVWKHNLVVFEPPELKHPNHVLLFITGGSNEKQPGPEERLLGMGLATMSGSRVAMLYQVPNQPLLGGRKEDDLISDTFLFYLATKDARWPLLFPMVKSAVRAMDCIEQLAAQEWKTPVEGFVVTGASKRGWTTWLSAVADRRVRGIAPIVIDTLNMPKQMDYQMETWGRYSEQIDDYERKGLIRKLKEDSMQPLWNWVDPWTYRQQLTLPKLIINGTNDRYWTVDALNNYWDDLSGDKHIRYVPNAGHNLKGGREGALITLAAFAKHVATSTPLPSIEWKHSTEGDNLRLTINPKQPPLEVRLWTASSTTKDFRDATWNSRKVAESEGRFVAETPRSPNGHIALFGEIVFRFEGLDYTLSTQIRRE